MKKHHLALLSLSALLAANACAQDTTPPATTPAKPVRLNPAIPATKLTAAPGQTATGQPATAPKPTLLADGKEAPDFLSNDAAGKAVHLTDYKGKVVVLDFWATWCGPCLASLPHTQEVAKKLKGSGVIVLACCTSDTRAKFDEWVKANQEKYPDIHFTSDPNERGSATYADRASLKLFGVAGIPTQFIVGRDGKVLKSLVGYRQGETRLEEFLAQVGSN